MNSSKPTKDSNRGVGPRRPWRYHIPRRILLFVSWRCSIELIGCGKELDSAERTTSLPLKNGAKKGGPDSGSIPFWAKEPVAVSFREGT